MKELAAKIGEASVTIEQRANAEGHLFGSVSAAQIAAALRDKGINVDDKQVRLEQPLKEIGVFDVVVHLHATVDATVKVWVVQQKPA
jgi:large subunit ribosomal protein L9